MDLAEDPTLPDLLKSPLWLQIRHKDLTWLFELKAGEERAVVVGSQHRADVCIARPGVASMHFHFEREGDAAQDGHAAEGLADDVELDERGRRGILAHAAAPARTRERRRSIEAAARMTRPLTIMMAS